MPNKNLFSKKEYDTVKNNVYTIMTFDSISMLRTLSYTGLSMFRAVEELQKVQRANTKKYTLLLNQKETDVIHKFENINKKVSYMDALNIIEELNNSK